MAPSPDYSSIIHSPTFTFLVGPEHTKLTIQSALARHVSQPLDELMNSGLTRESRHHIALLEEEDVETFVGFCEFAYTGDYRVPARSGHGHKRGGSYGMAVPPPAPSPPGTPGMEAEGLGADAEEGQGEGKKGKKNKKKKGASKSIDEGSGALTPPSTPPPEGKEDPAVSGDLFDSEGPKSADIESPKQDDDPFVSQRPMGGNLWNEFTSIEYPRDTQIAGFPAPMVYESTPLPPGAVPYVLFHAKIYRFSARFLIPTLAQLSLNKLHDALMSFPLDSAQAQDNAPVILELLHFTFNNTDRTDPAFTVPNPSAYDAQRENQLRKLVVHYAACKIRELGSFKLPADEQPSPDAVSVADATPALDLRGLMDVTCELASDLVFRMM